MVQIVNLDPSEGNTRQRAFQQGLSNFMNAGSNAYESIRRAEAMKEMQRRQDEALSRQEMQREEDLALKYGVTPDAQTAYESGMDAGRFQRLSDLASAGQKLRAPSAYEKGLKERELKIKERDAETKRLALQQKAQQQGVAADPRQRLGKMGAEAQSKVASIATGMQALDDVLGAYKKGYTPELMTSKAEFMGVPVGQVFGIEDNPLTVAQNMLNEVVGRLQSGGAINEDELKTFRGLGPTYADKDPNIIAQKIKMQQEFLRNKAAAFGFSPEDLASAGLNIRGTSSDLNDTKQRLGMGPSSPTKPPGNWANVGQPTNPNAPAQVIPTATANMSTMPQIDFSNPDSVRAAENRLRELEAKGGR